MASVVGPLLLVSLCLAGFGLGLRKRGLDFWPFALALGSAALVAGFHAARYLLDLPFNVSAMIALGIILAAAMAGAFRVKMAVPRVPGGLLVSLCVLVLYCILILITYPGWDMSHHVPAVRDLMANVHPSAIALETRPGVVGGFYHYGVEALVAAGTWIAGGRGERYLFRLVETVFAAAGFWLILRLYTRLLGARLATASALVFFWAGNFLVLVNLFLLWTGKINVATSRLPALAFMTASGVPGPSGSFLGYAFQAPMSFGFPLFLAIAWLFLRGGKSRNLLAGLLTGPLLVMQVFLGVSAGTILVAWPFLKWWAEKRFSWENLLGPAAALASALATSIPFVILKGGGHGPEMGPYWLKGLAPSGWLETLLGPVIYLGLPFILAIPGAFLAIRKRAIPRESLAFLVALAFLGLIVPQFLGHPDFVKFFLLGGLGYSPFAGMSLLWLWERGEWGRACAVISVILMGVTAASFLALRWVAFISACRP